MPQQSANLLTSKRFLPLFLTQFFGAFNDNIFKNALIILITYRLAAQTGENAQILITIAAGLFILPFLLFSALAGQFADKYEKSRLIILLKIAEIVLMGLAALGFYLQSVDFLMGVLFLLGVQSTFFGPLKYAILPYHLKENELITGNAFVEAGTFLAILIGTILGGVLILAHAGLFMVCALTLLVAGAGCFSSYYIPQAPSAAPGLKVSYNIISQTKAILKNSHQSKDIFLCIVGISWFWLIGATFLSQFPTFVKQTLGAESGVVTVFLTVFSLGIGMGSLLCNRLLRGRIDATYVPIAALGMTVFMLDLFFASQQISSHTVEHLISVSQFLQMGNSWRILGDLFLISVCGGLYTVPLYAMMQSRSKESHRSRVIASNNIMNALFMVAATIITVILLSLGFSVTHVFLIAAIANALVAAYICRLLPEALIKSILRTVFIFLYRVEVRGLSHYPTNNERLLIVANHTSLLDAALIAAFLPEKPVFAINTYMAQKWWMKPFLWLVDIYPIDPTNPMATKSIIELVRNGKKCIIFPEGRITVTGSLMKVYEGPGMIADKANAKILPIRIDGAQYSPFSYLKGKVRIRWFPKIILTLLPLRQFRVPENIKGRKRRHFVGLALYDLMTDMIFESCIQPLTLFESLLNASAIHGKKHIIAEDIQRKPINYRQFISRSFILGKSIAKTTQSGEFVGVLLPNMVTTAVTFFALQAFGRVPAMLNYSAGTQTVLSACTTAKIKKIYTSHLFIERTKLASLVSTLTTAGIEILYLEDVTKSLLWLDKWVGLVAGNFFARAYYRHISRRQQTKISQPDIPAVILFTSGSEGAPKGVVLSHNNILANGSQLSGRVDFGPTDRIFNALPLFHSFGLTGGTLLPLLSGIKVFFYPSPLHYRIVPQLIYDTNSTIMFGTDTFLSGYAKYANNYDFYSLRYVFAGAEKLKDATRKIWSEQFGVRIFEGYGATETSPMLSTNTPMHNKAGTVGRLLPGINYDLEPVPGHERGGKLIVSGPNIMVGYLFITNPGRLVSPPNGKYDTGDIVDIDAEGYITILGRVKRFAKIGGEMVSLPAIENWLNDLWPGHMHAVVSIGDERKGEQIVLLTDYPKASRNEMLSYAKSCGINELGIPRQVQITDKMPLLGSGKVDYIAAKVCFEQHSKLDFYLQST